MANPKHSIRATEGDHLGSCEGCQWLELDRAEGAHSPRDRRPNPYREAAEIWKIHCRAIGLFTCAHCGKEHGSGFVCKEIVKILTCPHEILYWYCIDPECQKAWAEKLDYP